MQSIEKWDNGDEEGAGLVPEGGRDPETGRFVEGYAGGPGRPKAKRAAELRRELLAQTDIGDLREVWAKLLELAKGGDLPAIREVLDRTLGKTVAPVPGEDELEQNKHIVVSLKFDQAG
jgi:hypothetical protein